MDGYVGLILMDDTSPFDANGDGEDEAAPLYMYIGKKNSGDGGFLDRNGLQNGDLYVLQITDDLKNPTLFRKPSDGFNGGTYPNPTRTTQGRWLQIINARNEAMASSDGSTGYDQCGWPTQKTLWSQANMVGAFGFSRPEDVHTNPHDATEIVLVSTGVDSYDNGTDTFGTIYKIRNVYTDPRPAIVYDGDYDPARSLRSPDNVVWASDDYLYVCEDKAVDNVLETGEPLFGTGAVNPYEAGIVRLNPNNGNVVRILTIDRSKAQDYSILDPSAALDMLDEVGDWETSGVLEVTQFFPNACDGTALIATVQAHGIKEQDTVNPDSRITDGDLVEGGQLVMFCAPDMVSTNF